MSNSQNISTSTLDLDRLLITGERRSGTTLIANLLAAQAEMTIFRDYLHIDRLWNRAEVPKLETVLVAKQKQQILKAFNSVDNAKIGVNSEIREESFETLRDFYLLALDTIAKRPADVVGHKTTVSHNVLVPLLTSIPNLKAIYMLRDPRDVTLSASRRFEGEDLRGVVKSWRESFTEAKKILDSGDFEGRFMIVRYEELVLQKEKTIDKMSFFLGKQLLIPKSLKDYGNRWQDNSSFGDVQGVLDSKPVGRWRTEGKKIGLMVESQLDDLMAAAGYPKEL